jgi:hypothetical protein
MSSGRVEHSGFPYHPKFFGLVQAVAGFMYRRGTRRSLTTWCCLFEADSISEANWLQFLGPSVVAFTDRGEKRLVGKVTFTKPISKEEVTVETTLLPSETHYVLDSEPSSPFASSPDTALCESLSSGKEKISFFDQPIGNIEGAKKALTPFLHDFGKLNGHIPEALVLVAEFYSYLVVRNTTIYLIRWKADHEFLVVPETKELLQADYTSICPR